MKRMLKTLMVACVVVGALTAVAAASASAHTFKANELGTLSGSASSNQVFTTGSGNKKVTCTKAATTGMVTLLEAAEQEVSVTYTGCTAFGILPAEVTESKYELHAGGTVDILNTIIIKVPSGGCELEVAPQSGLGSVTYHNTPSGEITEESAVTGISETVLAGGSFLCGTSTTSATYTGNNVVHLNSGPPTSTLEWL